MIVLISLMTVHFPNHTQFFMRGAIAFASMDIFNSEVLYNELFTFKRTTPLNTQFETFKMESKTFFVNSGPFMIYIAIIFTSVLIRRVINQICVCLPRFKVTRWIGRNVYEEN